MLDPHDLGDARCANHPDRPAERACARCGTFVCSGCVVSGDLCLSCKSLLMKEGVPYSPQEQARAQARRSRRVARRAQGLVIVLATVGLGLTVAASPTALSVARGLAHIAALCGLVSALWGGHAYWRSAAGRPGPGVSPLVSLGELGGWCLVGLLPLAVLAAMYL